MTFNVNKTADMWHLWGWWVLTTLAFYSIPVQNQGIFFLCIPLDFPNIFFFFFLQTSIDFTIITIHVTEELPVCKQQNVSSIWSEHVPQAILSTSQQPQGQ